MLLPLYFTDKDQRYSTHVGQAGFLTRPFFTYMPLWQTLNPTSSVFLLPKVASLFPLFHKDKICGVHVEEFLFRYIISPKLWICVILSELPWETVLLIWWTLFSSVVQSCLGLDGTACAFILLLEDTCTVYLIFMSFIPKIKVKKLFILYLCIQINI